MPSTSEVDLLTVAAIRKPKGEGDTEYLFNERQRIFTMRAALKSAADDATLLQEAFKNKTPVKVELASRRPIIRKITAPSTKELTAFAEQRIPLEKPDKVFPIEVDAIDPTTFNIVDKYLKIACFKFCIKLVPNYARAKEIFDFCAQQTCSLGGPFAVTPCIPFQYVRDGCYARAHKMMWVITTKYRYCCEKVFSFANSGNDRLAVKADKWGGCCVTWWYHVAPLIRVKVGNLFVLALVIDPGMFDKPVLLSTWLSAQKNKTCSPNANVSMYSIQPGSAYAPANYAGTAFSTDPTYASTNATLLAYQNLKTCP